MIRVGLIGAGFIGRNHFNQYEKLAGRAQVVALCDAEADRRAGDWSKVGGNLADSQGTKRDLGNIKPYTDWKALLADPNVDMVDICTPTFVHREITVAALKAGKHVLCEKPMALSVEHCNEMIAAARPPVRFMVAQCIRFWPEYVWLKKAVESGEFGSLLALHLRRQTSPPTYSLNNWANKPELSGGAILDLHVHDVDYGIYLLGKPKAVFAQGYQGLGGGINRVHASWDYGRPLVVQVEGYWDIHPGFGFNMGFTAVFENASVFWDSRSGQPLAVYRRDKDPETPAIPAGDGYFGEISHLIDCIERGVDPTTSTPAESRDAVAIALAEGQSVMTGRMVPIA
jgi:predicted dehydrogenase